MLGLIAATTDREIMISPSSGLNMEEEKKQEIVERDQDLEDQLPAAAAEVHESQPWTEQITVRGIFVSNRRNVQRGPWTRQYLSIYRIVTK